MKGCIGIKHTARDSSLIMCRTRRTIFPTASSACASCYYCPLMPISKGADQEKGDCLCFLSRITQDALVLFRWREEITKWLGCLQLYAPVPDIC